MIKLPEPVAYVVDGGKKNQTLVYLHEYHFELVAPKIMCKPLHSEAQLKQAVRDALSSAYGILQEYDYADSEMGRDVQALIKEIE